MHEDIQFEPVDMIRPPASLSNRLPDLTIVYERLFRALRARLFQDTRRGIKVINGGHRIVQHDDLLNSWPADPVLFAVVEISPLRGFSIIMIEGRLLSAIVDDLFGASGTEASDAGHDLTAMEKRIGESVIRMVAQSIDDALRAHLDVKVRILRTETHPTLSSVADAAEPYYGMFTNLELSAGGGGLIVGFPYRGLEAHRTALSSPAGASSRQDSDVTWDRQFRTALDEIEISLGVEIGTASIPLKRLASLKPGDVFAITLHRLARVTNGEAILGEAAFGRLNEESYGVIFKHVR